MKRATLAAPRAVIAVLATLVIAPARADNRPPAGRPSRPPAGRPSTSSDPGGDDRLAAAKAAWLVAYQVLMHPRCMNCHPRGDAPLQYDDSRPHAMNITRRSGANGVPCAACHRDRNGTRPGTPPGAPNWHLPPSDTPMIFEGRSAHDLCEQLKDPRQTGGRDLPHLIDHIAHDELVAWGWSPGPNRAPVPTPRATVISALELWAAAGAPCP